MELKWVEIGVEWNPRDVAMFPDIDTAEFIFLTRSSASEENWKHTEDEQKNPGRCQAFSF